MRAGKYDFRPGLWPSLATALLLPLLIGLGFWQLDRADQKQALLDAYQSRREAPALDLASVGARAFDPRTLVWRRARLRGEYLAGEQYLLDNQVVKGEAGYRIYTPFQLAGREAVVLVNRGWVPLGASRDTPPQVPPPSRDKVQTGIIKQPPSAGLVLEGETVRELGDGLLRVQRLDLDAIARRGDWRLLPYVVRLDASGDSKPAGKWPLPGFGPTRHLAYAFQWFALAAVLLILYLVLNTRRNEHD